MKLHSRSRALGAAVATLSVAAIAAASALAATPKPGIHYQLETRDGGSTQITVIQMQATDDGKLAFVSGASPKCQTEGGLYAGFYLDKEIKVSSAGKFKYDGKANSSTASTEGGPAKIKIKLKGKFTSAKKSKGSFTLEGCQGKTKFQTSFTTGG